MSSVADAGPTGSEHRPEGGSSWRQRLVGLAEALAMVVLTAAAGIAASIVVGTTTPAALLGTQGMAPFWLVITPAVMLWWLVRRRWLSAGVAAVVTGVFVILCVPAATTDESPGWVAEAPTFRLYAANLRFDNDRSAEAVESIMEVAADVVVLNEVMPAHLELLRSAGAFDRYPVHEYVGDQATFGELIMSRLPDSRSRRVRVGRGRTPGLEVRVGGTVVEVWAVHVPAPPASAWRASAWERGFSDLTRAATAVADRRPLVLAGDFNASVWNRPLRDLLDTGFTDAHDALGDGLSRSWAPAELRGIGGPLLRLDHSLSTDGVWPQRVENLAAPGSDHRAFVVTLAVRPQPPS